VREITHLVNFRPLAPCRPTRNLGFRSADRVTHRDTHRNASKAPDSSWPEGRFLPRATRFAATDRYPETATRHRRGKTGLRAPDPWAPRMKIALASARPLPASSTRLPCKSQDGEGTLTRPIRDRRECLSTGHHCPCRRPPQESPSRKSGTWQGGATPTRSLAGPTLTDPPPLIAYLREEAPGAPRRDRRDVQGSPSKSRCGDRS